MMKKFTLIIIALIGSMFVEQANAQCITPENTWNNLVTAGTAPCFNGVDCTPLDGAFVNFGIFGSEGYTLSGVEAGAEYIFDMCTGTGAGAWIPEITIVAADGITVDAWNGEPATGSTLTFVDNCTISWVASQAGDYTIVINELGTFSGDAPAQTGCGITLAVDNGNPVVSCGTTTPALCLPEDFDVVVADVRVVGSEARTPNGGTFSYFPIDFSQRTAVDIEVDIENIGGLALDTIIIEGVLEDETATGLIEWSDTIDLTGAPLAPGGVYTHTYPTTDLTATFPGQTNSDRIFFQADLVLSPFNTDTTEEDTDLRFLMAPVNSFTAPFLEGFEVIVGQFFVFNMQSWGWKFFDNDADENTFGIYSFANILAQEGSYQIIGSIVPPNFVSVDAVDEVVQSPEFTLDAGTAYAFSIYARTILNQSGNFAMSLVNQDGSTPNEFLGTVSMTGGDSTYVKYTFETIAAASETDYMLNIIKSSAGLIALDQVEIVEVVAPSVSASISGLDDAGAMIEYCDSTINLNVTTSGNPSFLSVDWGDGTPAEALAISSGGAANATHSYASTGNYTVNVTAGNIVDTATTDAAFQLTAVPAANADVVVVSGPDPLGNITIINNSTPVCSEVIIDWGDGTPVGSANSVGHDYQLDGVYTITVTVSSPGSVNQQTIEVVVATGIDEVNFVEALSVYPNPASDLVNVVFELGNSQDVAISISSVDGRIVANQALENVANVNTNFNVSKLNSGVYMMTIKTENGSSTQRFVVSHQ